MGVWKVRESMSSDAIPQHLPPRTSSAHCASASPGAWLVAHFDDVSRIRSKVYYYQNSGSLKIMEHLH